MNTTVCFTAKHTNCSDSLIYKYWIFSFYNNIYFSAATFQKVNSNAVEKIIKAGLCENDKDGNENDEEDIDDDDVFGDLFQQ